VKGSAASEQTILVGVTQARADATKITVTGDQLSDPQAMQRFADAQNRLTLSLQRLQEAYPQLQSQGNYKTLMDQLEGTENRINIAIRDYNGGPIL
jgi:LemA protein